MRSYGVLAFLAGCSFRHGVLEPADAAPSPDVAIDAEIDAPPPAFCASDPHLRLCYSFDQDPLPTSLPNEGAATVSASLTAVTRTTHDASGAAQISATSIIHVPYTAEIASIQAMEVWFRLDEDAPINGARIGILDSNVIPPNISLFWYRVDPGHQLRCGLGGALLSYDATLALGTWYHVACICSNDTLLVMLDGTKIGETPTSGCSSGGALVDPAGLTIGANNNGGPSGVDERLIGAIDGVRLWDVVPPP